METELCLLWDMTIEPDVVELLMQHNFLELTSRIIRESNIPRLMVSYGSGVEYPNCAKYATSHCTVDPVALTDLSLVVCPCAVSGINFTIFC
jgi:hypothetical protein